MPNTRRRSVTAFTDPPGTVSGSLSLHVDHQLLEAGEECFEPINCLITVREQPNDGPQLPAVTIGTIGLWRLRPARDPAEWLIEMGWQSPDFITIASVLDTESDRLEPRFSLPTDPEECVLIAHVVSLDPYWRGGGIGPAAVRMMAWEYEARMVALEPANFAVKLNTKGEPVPDFDGPRGGSHIQAKVRRAWRRGGYEPIGRKVWAGWCNDDSYFHMQDVFHHFDDTVNTPSVRQWLLERRALTRGHADI